MVFIRSLGVLLVLALALTGGAEASTGPATERLKEFFGAVNRVIVDPATDDNPLEKLAAIRRLVQDIGDWDSAAARALGPEWKARTPAEQDEFVRLFADLLQRAFVVTMAGKARVDGGVVVTWLGERREGGEVFVATTVSARSGSTFAVEYRLTDASGDWRIRDVLVEGVSLVENYRAQFVAMLRRGPYADLVAEMRSRVSDSAPVAIAAVEAPAAPVAPAPRTSAPAPSTEVAATTWVATARPVVDPVPVGLAERPAESAQQPAGPAPRLLAAATDPGVPQLPTASATRPAPRVEIGAPPARPTLVMPAQAAPQPMPAPMTRVALRVPEPSSGLRVPVTPLPAISAPAAGDTVKPPRNAGATGDSPPSLAALVPPALPAPRPAGLAPALAPRATVNTLTAVTRDVAARAVPTYWVQVGAFRSSDAAARLIGRLKSWALTIVTGPLTRALGTPEDTLARVLVGPFTQRAEAVVALKRLQASGVPGFITEDRR